MALHFLTSPLEQFQVLPIIPIYFGNIDISITNETVILTLIIIFSLLFICSVVNNKDKSFYLIPTVWQGVLELFYKVVFSLITENIQTKNSQQFFPLIFFIFLFILLLNLIGLIPYSFTITSHIIVTFFLSLSIFIGINIICFRIHGIKMLSLFLPGGTSVILSFLLIPIELISYVFKPISLSIRLFANMMAGHILLKVIAGFAFTLMENYGILFICHFIPLAIILPLFLLEFGVALIQSFVFSILICIYLNDCFNLH